MTESMSDLLATDSLLTALGERRAFESGDPVVVVLAELVRRVDAERIPVVVPPAHPSAVPFVRRASVAVAAVGALAFSSSGISAAVTGDPLVPLRYVAGKLYEQMWGDGQPERDRFFVGQAADAAGAAAGDVTRQPVDDRVVQASDSRAMADGPARAAPDSEVNLQRPLGHDDGAAVPAGPIDDQSTDVEEVPSEVPADPATVPPPVPDPASTDVDPTTGADTAPDVEPSPETPSVPDTGDEVEQGDVLVEPSGDDPVTEQTTQPNGKAHTGGDRPDTPRTHPVPQPKGAGQPDSPRPDGRLDAPDQGKPAKDKPRPDKPKDLIEAVATAGEQATSTSGTATAVTMP